MCLQAGAGGQVAHLGRVYVRKFEVDAEGRVKGFTLNAPRVWNLRFEKRLVPQPSCWVKGG
jgi:hypothetical protein